jgi:hypothetical protein
MVGCAGSILVVAIIGGAVIGGLWLLGHLISGGVGTGKRCPFCQSVIHRKAIRCPKCQADLPRKA